MGHKWEKLKGTVDPFAEEPEVQRRVEAAKVQLVGVSSGEHSNLGFLGKLLITRRQRKEQLEGEVKKLNIELEALSQLIKDRLEEEGQDRAKLTSGATIYTDVQPYSSVEDRKALFEWIEKTDSKFLLSVQWNTMNSFVKGQLEQGKPAPPGVKVFLKTDIRVRGIGEKDNKK